VLGAAIGLTTAVWQVAILRAGSWIARGLRSPSRDALLSTLAPRVGYGRAYGLERAGDNLGALVGPLLAAALVSFIGIRPTLLLAAIPGLFAAVAISIAARQAGRFVASPAGRRRMYLNLALLHQHGLIRALIPAALFECGNIATTLLILRATDLLHTSGRSLAAATSTAILIYAVHDAVAALASLAGGTLIDRFGSRPLFAAGAGIYVLAYAGFAVGTHAWPLLLVAFCLAGTGIGLAEPAQSTLVAHALPDARRGSGFGLLGAVQAGGDLLSSASAGHGVLAAGGAGWRVSYMRTATTIPEMAVMAATSQMAARMPSASAVIPAINAPMA
jgi:MFS family permease